MKNRFKRGFTLIELLVVIAIIGVLASVVLASLNSARSKGNDSAIKANLANARAQAEIFYDGTGAGDYDGVCNNAAGTIYQNMIGADNANGGATALSNSDCNENDTAWAMAAQMVGNTATYYCVDSTGAAKVVTGSISTANSGTGSHWDTDLAAGLTACP